MTVITINEWFSTRGGQGQLLAAPLWRSPSALEQGMSRPANAMRGIENSDIGQPDRWLSFAFAFVGGYGDVAGFILAKTFTGHVTGNLVLAAIAVVAHDWRSIFAHCSAVAVFLTGIPMSVLIARLLAAWPPWLLLTTVVAIEVVLILAAYLALASHAAARVEVFVICMSLALGLQNGAFRRTGGIGVHTNYLTGTLTGLIASKVEKLALQVSPAPAIAVDSKSRLLSGIWAAFVLGALTGAAAVLNFKEPAILGAALVLLAIIARNSVMAVRSHPAGRKAQEVQR